jgi:hypothetical protein
MRDAGAPTGPRNVQIRPVALASTGLPTEQTRRRLDSVIQFPSTEDGKKFDLGAWLTLANGNGVSFPSAHTQIVAGRVNRESGEVEPIDAGGPVLADCWPRGSTSDPPELLQIARASPAGFGENRSRGVIMSSPVAAGAFQEVVVTGAAIQEQLGDLKLYRVPEPTTVASRQSKQVRLLDRTSIPFTRLYKAELGIAQMDDSARRVL